MIKLDLFTGRLIDVPESSGGGGGFDGQYSSLTGIPTTLTLLAPLSTTAFGRGFLELADQAAGRIHLALGTAAVANTGTASGNVPVLDITGKIPTSLLPASVLGDVQFQDTWDADANDPVIPAADPTNKGHYYVVSTAGDTDIDGETDWKVGDWLVSNGATWNKIDNTDLVTSVAGRVGAVVLTTADVNDSSNRRYVSDAQLVVIGNTSGINTGDQNLSGLAVAGRVGSSGLTTATATLIGRTTAGTGALEELSAATVRSFLSLNLVENTALSTWAGSTNLTTLGTIGTGTWQGTSISTTYTDAKIKTVTGTTNRLSIGGTATDPTFDIAATYVGQSSITTLGTIGTGVWQGTSIGTGFTDAKIKTVTGTTNRVTIGGTATDPTFDISTSYVGQASITTVGTIGTGIWNGTAITTAYTQAQIISVAGTTNRLSISGTPTDPTFDISAAYIGQSSITTVGTIASGTWNGGVISGQYGGTGVANTGKTITLGGNVTTSGAFALTLTLTATTSVTLPTSGTLATLAGAESLTNKKLGSLTSNGFVITSGGDGTLGVDTVSYQPFDSDLNAIAALTTTSFGRAFLALVDQAGGRSYLGLGTAALADTGTSSGNVPVLDGTGKIPTSLLPSSVLGDVQFQDTWNATTNTPTIPAAASGNKGWYYVVATAGSTSIDGITDWKVGDWLVSNGATWNKIDNTDLVTSVAGRVGAVTLTASDITDATTVGLALVTLANPSAVSFVRINADNSVTTRSAANFKSDLSLNNVENTALSTWAGTTNITTLGTIGTGTWQGTAIATTYIANSAVTYAKIQDISATLRILGRKTAGAGVTEELTITEAIDFVTGTPARGDILYRNASFWSRLAAGTSGQFLKTQGSSANPIWADATGVVITATLAKSANFTVTAAERGSIYFVTTGASTITATLPAAATAGAGWHIMLLKSDSGAGTIATSPSINTPTGLLPVIKQRDVVMVFSDGSNYYAMLLPSSAVVGTANEITATSSTGTMTLSLPTAMTMTGKTMTGGTYQTFVATQAVNGNNIFVGQRITDSSPTGGFLTLINASFGEVFSINVSGVLTSTASATFYAPVTTDQFLAANTSGDGFILQNTDTASSGNQMYSPRVHWSGRGWKTTATAASQQVDAIMELRPVQGAANPTSLLAIATQINGGGYTDRFTISDTGQTMITLNSVIPTALPTTGVVFNLLGANALGAGFNVTAFGAVTALKIQRYNNTAASPTTMASGDIIGQLAFQGFDGTDFSSTPNVTLRVVTDQAFTTGAHGAHLRIFTTAAGAVNQVEAMRVQGSGGVSVGNVTTDPGVGKITVTTAYNIGANQVLKARITGWSTGGPAAVRTAMSATPTATEVGARLRALIDDLHQTAGHGLIGT